MNNIMECFPIINEDVVRELDLKYSFKANYLLEGQTYDLEISPKDESYDLYLDDARGQWKTKDNLNIIGNINLENTNRLFTVHKVAEKTSVLGIAIVCNSKKTSKTFTKPIGEILYKENGFDNIDIEFLLEFKNNELSSKINFQIVIYLKSIVEYQKYLASNIGTILGVIYDGDLLLEGDGSSFPVEIVEEQNGLLWNHYCNFEDYYDDMNTNTICLRLNSLHKDYKYINTEAIDKSNHALWKEILSSFFQRVLIDVENVSGIMNIMDDNDVIKAKDSVGAFVKYLIETFEISYHEYTNPNALFDKIRKKIDKLI